MWRPTLELNLFGMEKGNSAKSQFQKLLEQQRKARGFQCTTSDINPQFLKILIDSGAITPKSFRKSSENVAFREDAVTLPTKIMFPVPSSPNGNQSSFPKSPVVNPVFGPTCGSPPGTAPLTIFFNGTVTVFYVSNEQAERIIQLAKEAKHNINKSACATHPGFSGGQLHFLETLEGELPIARKRSLQRFLEKRKERLTSVVPYASLHE